MARWKLSTGKLVIDVENPDAQIRNDIIKRMAGCLIDQIDIFLKTKVVWALEEANRTGNPITVSMSGPQVTITPSTEGNAKLDMELKSN